MKSLREFTKQVASAVGKSDGKALARLLVLDDQLAAAASQEKNWEAACASLSDVVKPMIMRLLECLAARREGNHVEAHERMLESFRAFLELMKDSTSWILVPSEQMTRNLKTLAWAADAAEPTRGSDRHVNEVVHELRKYLAIMHKDSASGADTKRGGLLYGVNAIMSCYFKVNQLSLCVSLLRTVESYTSGSDFERMFPIRHKVVYRYYVGRLMLSQGDFKAADEMLSYAFEHSARGHFANKRHVLAFLIPVKWIAGVFPSEQLCAKFSLDEYGAVLSAVRRGQIAEFDRVLATHESYFIRLGVMLLMEKLRLLTCRNLFRRAWLLLPADTRSKTSLAHFQLAARLSGAQLSDDELECLLANMIAQNWVKGYIHQERRIAVLHKTLPFPPVASLV
eukprot:Amastigsp_a1422_94.p1 type:complete len:396 gc:universal Amastigsp_a1422_94:46-1233(+)